VAGTKKPLLRKTSDKSIKKSRKEDVQKKFEIRPGQKVK
jgi:hypothetical protein